MILSYILVYLRVVDEEMLFLLYWTAHTDLDQCAPNFFSVKVKVGQVDIYFFVQLLYLVSLRL